MTDEFDYIEYRTKAGDRWDLIAYDHYGDAMAYERIVTANPDVPIRPTLDGGIILKIPVIDDQPATPGSLPPWKRSAQ